jgi:hypothetical protein
MASEDGASRFFASLTPQSHNQCAYDGELNPPSPLLRPCPRHPFFHAKPLLLTHSLVAGFALSLIGSIFFAIGQIPLFATLYVLGVVVSLIGTGFLVGFAKQVKMMWDPVRRYAAGIFVLCIALTFVFAFVVEIECVLFFLLSSERWVTRYLHFRSVLVIVFAVCTFLAYLCAFMFCLRLSTCPFPSFPPLLFRFPSALPLRHD